LNLTNVCSLVDCSYLSHGLAYAKKALHQLALPGVFEYVHNHCIQKRLVISYTNFARIYFVEKTQLLGM